MKNLSRVGLAVIAVLAIAMTGSAPNIIAAPVAPAAAPAPPSPDADGADRTVSRVPSSPTANPEDVYKPITPCRIVDTRSGTGTNGTPFASLATRTFYVAGTFGFAPQGGKSGGCGIPANATAVAAVLTAVNPGHSGYIRTWPVGVTEPTATLLNYGSVTTGTGGTLTIKPVAGKSLTVKNYVGPTDVVIDIQGYYLPQIQGQVDLDGNLVQGTNRVISAVRNSVGTYTVTVDRSINGCAVNSHPYGSGPYFINGYASGNTIRAYAYGVNGAAVDIQWQFSVNC